MTPPLHPSLPSTLHLWCAALATPSFSPPPVSFPLPALTFLPSISPTWPLSCPHPFTPLPALTPSSPLPAPALTPALPSYLPSLPPPQRLEDPASAQGLSPEEMEARDEAREKFRILRTVLEQGGHFSGINRWSRVSRGCGWGWGKAGGPGGRCRDIISRDRVRWDRGRGGGGILATSIPPPPSAASADGLRWGGREARPGREH